MSQLARKECHRCFWRVPGIVDAKKLPDKDPARFQCRLEPGKDCGKLLFLRKWQREMGVDQIVAREGKILEGRFISIFQILSGSHAKQGFSGGDKTLWPLKLAQHLSYFFH